MTHTALSLTSFLPVDSDVPGDMTLREWRRSLDRERRSPRRWFRR